ncbi:formate dehydrogenase accessory sulfurtransferase FdhD [Limimaricola sp.]|uniref:formate dehydrogenase accessory sulfurtransferase FdhD n=1 Tax=Limimaricola sp. TaxID=2211665 RepID=UPI0025BD9A3C|nr:formate dehydrogenase accessory sulfurtransferase FdhD [Limimaricola sp.]
MHRALPEETPVALVYNGSTQAVMMATPDDLADFGIGFSLTEGIVRDAAEVESLDVLTHDSGVEVQMWLAEDRATAMAARRRQMMGPVGCGLCGIDSLDEALRPLPQVAADLHMTAAEIDAAMDGLAARQPLHDQTRAVHAAGFYRPGTGIIAAREDVGRHNALDKLIGALATAGEGAATGAIVITSRISVDMVQKCVIAGAPVLIAASAPTAHAVRIANAAGLTLVGLARGRGFDIFTHPERIV